MHVHVGATCSSLAEPVLHQERDVKTVQYSGRVWCVTLPHGFIITRRAVSNYEGIVTKASVPIIMGNCLFDKGLTLQRPEIVLLRLTPNMVDAFGLSGYEGVFRRVCKVTMDVLRDNKETLLSVLDTFVHDPLVEWSRNKTRNNNAPDLVGAAADEGEVAYPEAVKIKEKVSQRLSGIYVKRTEERMKSGSATAWGAGGSLPLSTQGQVHRLIEEATNVENLCQMYIGWMPFL